MSLKNLFLATLFVVSGTAAHGQAPTADETVLALFEKRCAECHKDGEEPELSSQTNLGKLRADTHYVVATDIESSELLARCLLPPDDKKRMPRSKGKPGDEKYRDMLTAQELDVIRAWLKSGTPARPFISEEEINEAILQDLESLRPLEARPHMRYVTLANVANATNGAGQALVSDAQLKLFIAAVRKLLNSLSHEKEIWPAESFGPGGVVLRVYLPAYGWNRPFWDKVAAHYPYAVDTGSRSEKQIQELTRTLSPRLRADWFVFAMAQPPFYHEALGLPEAGKDGGADFLLERSLGINVLENLRGLRATRAGFEKSGVSEANRVIERHAQKNGAGYWKSYDFDPNRKNEPGGDIFGAPLGPVGSLISPNASHEFKHDGGEIIYSLPNGLQAYLLTDAKGNRLNSAPTNIVQDSSRKDGVIINGISCMSCHHMGMFPPPKDEVAAISGQALRAQSAEAVEALYNGGQISRFIEEDSRRFAQALGQCKVELSSNSREEPVRALYDFFQSDVTIHQLASELGTNDPAVIARLKDSRDDNVRVQFLKLHEGSVIPRGNFISAFRDFMGELSIGKLREAKPAPFEEFGGDKAFPPEIAKLIGPGASVEELQDAVNKVAIRYVIHGYQMMPPEAFIGGVRFLLPVRQGLTYTFIAIGDPRDPPIVIDIYDEVGARMVRGRSGMLEYRAPSSGTMVVHFVQSPEAVQAKRPAVSSFGRILLLPKEK